jgi:CheY-like chemotaxis protein/HPt (histidine-containing phosphotransfer) domain-containing protein
MPGMDGLELARTIEEDPILRNLRRIVLTSVDQGVSDAERRKAGISAWLTKPVRTSQLYNCLVTVMDGAAPREAREDYTLQAHNRFDALILLAEDNPVNQEVALNMCEALGCRVVVVANGLEAVEALSGSDFDLILMDCQMPEMDGYEATEAIRNGERAEEGGKDRIPIVALTAHAMEGDRDRCLAGGMDDYLAKPFSQDQLQEVLGRWLPGKAATPGIPIEMDRNRVEASDGGNAEEGSIDHEALEKIRALQRQGKPDLLARVINIYLEDSLRLLESLRQALSRGEGVGVYRRAHSLKSSSANVGALRLAALCEDLEKSGERESMDQVHQRIARIEEEYETVRIELTAELQRIST